MTQPPAFNPNGFKCVEFQQHLEIWLETPELLEPALKTAMIHHVESCFSCQHLLHTEKLLIKGLQKIPKVAPPSEITDHIMLRLEQQAQSLTSGQRGVATFSKNGHRLPSQATPVAWKTLAAAIGLIVLTGSSVWMLPGKQGNNFKPEILSSKNLSSNSEVNKTLLSWVPPHQISTKGSGKSSLQFPGSSKRLSQGGREAMSYSEPLKEKPALHATLINDLFEDEETSYGESDPISDLVGF